MNISVTMSRLCNEFKLWIDANLPMCCKRSRDSNSDWRPTPYGAEDAIAIRTTNQVLIEKNLHLYINTGNHVSEISQPERYYERNSYMDG